MICKLRPKREIWLRFLKIVKFCIIALSVLLGVVLVLWFLEHMSSQYDMFHLVFSGIAITGAAMFLYVFLHIWLCVDPEEEKE